MLSQHLLRRLCSRVLLAGTHPRNGSPQLPWVTAVIFKLWCPLTDDFPQHPRGRSSSTHHCYSILATFPPSTGPQPGPFQQGLGLTLGSPAAGGGSLPWALYLSPRSSSYSLSCQFTNLYEMSDFLGKYSSSTRTH